MSDNAPLLRRLDAPYEFDNGEEDESVVPGLAALLKHMNAEKSEAAAEIRRLEAKVAALHDLDLDNHHNAVRCPYCNPDDAVFISLAHIRAREQAVAQRMRERCLEALPQITAYTNEHAIDACGDCRDAIRALTPETV